MPPDKIYAARRDKAADADFRRLLRRLPRLLPSRRCRCYIRAAADAMRSTTTSRHMALVADIFSYSRWLPDAIEHDIVTFHQMTYGGCRHADAV